MPRKVQDVGPGSPPELRQERADWLEANGLTLVDFMSWKRAQDPLAKLRPPSRRKLMSPDQLAAFDAQREREGEPPW
jgi:hypothetical protein